MIRSMTGYGGAKGTVEGLSVTVELKSVNNRYLDIAVRMPRNFLFAEDAVKSTIQQHVSRGKLDVFVTIDSSQAEDTVLRVNEPLLRAYIDTLNALAVRYDLKNDMSLMSLMRFPDILSVEKAEADQDKIRAGLIELTQQALADYDQMREREGEKLRADVEEKLARIESLVARVETAAPETAAAYEARLRQKLEAVLSATDIDEARIIAEAAIFADHVAVDEETVRLRSHIAQLRQMLESGSPVGRKADFLIQEFNRSVSRSRTSSKERRLETHQHRIRKLCFLGAAAGCRQSGFRPHQAHRAGQPGDRHAHRCNLRPKNAGRPHHGYRPRRALGAAAGCGTGPC